VVRLKPEQLKVNSLEGIKLIVTTLGGVWGKLCWKTSTPNLNVQSLGCLKRLTKAMKAMWQGMKSCLKIWLLKEPL
jgi:hypothetical protein